MHCSNSFSASPDFHQAVTMLRVNFTLPAKVLRVAVEASAKSFTNLGSGWQLDPVRLESSPDYTASKNAFSTFLQANKNRLVTRTIFLNEVFGRDDPRPKLIKLAVDTVTSGNILKVRSLDSKLGLTFLPRLSEEVVGVVVGGQE